jgi:hypothetical protein
MQSPRAQLEAMDREGLIARATELGVERPEVLTRPEIIDEIVVHSVTDEQERAASRGLLGRARDLVARVLEKGLHLPEAAERLITLAPPSSGWRKGPPPLATVALAEIYIGQGHIKRALDVLKVVLEREPEHAYARQLRDRVIEQGATLIEQASSPNSERQDDTEGAEHVEVTAHPGVPKVDSVRVQVEPIGGYLIQWSLRARSFAAVRARMPEGRLVLRLLEVQGTWAGPSVRTKDLEIEALSGHVTVTSVEASAELCVALGWRHASEFQALAVQSR